MSRPSPSKTLSSGPLIIVALAAASAAGGIVSWVLESGVVFDFRRELVVFALFVTLGELLEIPLGRRTIFSLGLAPALGFALLRECVTATSTGCITWASPSIGEVTIVFMLGTLGGVLIRSLLGRQPSMLVGAAQLPVIVTAAATYRALVAVAPNALPFGPQETMTTLGLFGVVCVVVVLDVVLQAVLAISRERLPVKQAIKAQARVTGPLLVSTVSVAALLALAYPPLEAWTLPLFLAPLAATQFSFRQVAGIRKNYLQTVRALSKVPEMAGYTEREHSTRVAALSVAIANDLGVVDPELHEIEYAALLHDIGRISLPDPEDSIKSTSNLQLALVGAGIIEETGHLPTVATMVREQHEPYRRRGEDVNRTLTTGAKIIKVASAFDDLTYPAGPGRTPWDALEKLHLGMAYEYDPKVIQALTRELERAGRI